MQTSRKCAWSPMNISSTLGKSHVPVIARILSALQTGIQERCFAVDKYRKPNNNLSVPADWTKNQQQQVVLSNLLKLQVDDCETWDTFSKLSQRRQLIIVISFRNAPSFPAILFILLPSLLQLVTHNEFVCLCFWFVVSFNLSY